MNSTCTSECGVFYYLHPGENKVQKTKQKKIRDLLEYCYAVRFKKIHVLGTDGLHAGLENNLKLHHHH